jgi:hypothetical protein
VRGDPVGGSAGPDLRLRLGRRGDDGRVRGRHRTAVRRPRLPRPQGGDRLAGTAGDVHRAGRAHDGLYTLNGGLELSGSPLAASRLADAAGLGPARATEPAGPAASADAPPLATTDGRQTVVVTARTGSYSPENLEIRSGIPTTLVIRSDHVQGCIRAFVIPSRNKQWILPVNGDTKIELGTLTTGRLDYSCGMGMYTGTLTIV